MVGDDDVDSGATKSRDRADGAGSAIASDEHLRRGCQRRVHAGVTQIVAILDASRNEWNRLPAQPANDAGENRRRTDTINVVVTVDEDQLLLADSAREPLDRLVHRQEAQRIVQAIAFRAEEALGLIGRDVAA